MKKVISSIGTVLVLIAIILLLTRDQEVSVPQNEPNTSTDISVEVVEPPANSQTPQLVIGEVVVEEEPHKRIRYPLIEGDSVLATQVANNINEFVTFAQDEEVVGNIPYEYIVEVRVLHGTYTTSVILVKYSYTGGAHGMTSYETMTVMNTAEGEEVTITDLYPTPEAQENLVTAIEQNLLAREEAGDLFLFEGAVEEISFDQLSTYTIENNSFILYFGQYEIAPYSSGIIDVEIPLTQEQRILLKEKG